MPKQPGAIYLATHPGGWKVEVRISDKSKRLSIEDFGSYRNNVCREVKGAFKAADPTNYPSYINWDDLKLEFLRPD